MSKEIESKNLKTSFEEISHLIQQSRLSAIKSVNKELILLY